MNLRLLATPLAVALLLSTLGCSKKEDAKPIVSTGSYKLDGRTVTCQIVMRASTLGSGQLANDYLDVQLTTLPSQAGAETLHVGFTKSVGQPTNAYRYAGLSLVNSASPNGLFFVNNLNATISETGSGFFSGTFSGTATSPPGTPVLLHSSVSDGVFTNAHL